MNTTKRWTTGIALCLLLGAGAVCAGDDGTSGAASLVDNPINPASAKPNWLWIGERVNTAQACPGQPMLPNWKIQPLFCEPLDPEHPDNGQCAQETPNQIPPGLRGFCSYEFAVPDVTVPMGDITKLKNLVTTGKLKSVVSDPMGVAGFASGIQDETWQMLETQFKQQVGRPTSSFLAFPASPLVRLAIVDTQPTDDVDSDLIPHNSPHGNTLANMADELMCNNTGKCAAGFASRLALGYKCQLNRNVNKSNCRDPDLGGFHGTIGQLARAIRLETRTWIDPAVSGHRLILNLSVAWDPRFGGLESNVNSMPLPARAVYSAIADAQCRGALTLAAAGNVTGGPEDQIGPLLPGAWEQRAALTQSQCTSRLGFAPPPIFPPGTDTRPFVYAVAGVNGAGTELGNARIDSEPKLVAYGDHADVEDESQPSLTPSSTLTGSSVATLVASAAAAWTWFYADSQISPQLKPFEIMDTVYNKGIGVGRQADFCRGGTPATPCPGVPPQVMEVQICSAIDSIAGGPSCPTIDPLVLDITDSGFTHVSLASLTSSVVDPACNGMTTHFAPAFPPGNACPFEEFFSELAEPWTSPQPHESACPNCGTGGHNLNGTTTTLFLEIDTPPDPRFNWTLTDATLQCGDILNRLPVGTLASGSKIAVDLDDADLCPAGSDMLIHFRDSHGEAVLDAIVESQ